MPFGYRCQHLIIEKLPGTPEATWCAAYEFRHDGMPILLFGRNGSIVGTGKCWKGSQKETEAIMELGVGRGCSLTPEED